MAHRCLINSLPPMLTNPIFSINIRNMIPRLIEDLVFSSLTSFQKIILVLGARQVGKTTLVCDIGKKLEGENKKVLY